MLVLIKVKVWDKPRRFLLSLSQRPVNATIKTNLLRRNSVLKIVKRGNCEVKTSYESPHKLIVLKVPLFFLVIHISTLILMHTHTYMDSHCHSHSNIHDDNLPDMLLFTLILRIGLTLILTDTQSYIHNDVHTYPH